MKWGCDSAHLFVCAQNRLKKLSVALDEVFRPDVFSTDLETYWYWAAPGWNSSVVWTPTILFDLTAIKFRMVTHLWESLRVQRSQTQGLWLQEAHKIPAPFNSSSRRKFGVITSVQGQIYMELTTPPPAFGTPMYAHAARVTGPTCAQSTGEEAFHWVQRA